MKENYPTRERFFDNPKFKGQWERGSLPFPSLVSLSFPHATTSLNTSQVWNWEKLCDRETNLQQWIDRRPIIYTHNETDKKTDSESSLIPRLHDQAGSTS